MPSGWGLCFWGHLVMCNLNFFHIGTSRRGKYSESTPWQAEQAHHTPSKEKQSVPDGERPVVHIAIVCGLWQGASYSGRTLFLF